MRPSELSKLISNSFKAGIERPIHLEASPGVGKTAIAGQIAQDLGVGFMVVHAPLLQPEDYGFPVISADRKNVSFIVSREKFPIVGSDCPDTGILLIDELPQAGNAEQKILANLLNAREIHGQRLKPGWAIITTGNRAVDRAGANRLLSHLSDRVTVLELDVSVDDWVNWALNSGVKTEVIQFIRFRPELLNKFDAQAIGKSPTPRAWAQGVSARLGVIDAAHEFYAFKGDVGEGAAAEFCAFLQIYRDLPSPDAIMLDPQGAPVPDKAAVLYALTGALSTKATGNNFGTLMQYVDRMPPEFSLLFVQSAIRCKAPVKDPSGKAKACNKCDACSIKDTRDFTKWSVTSGAKLLS